MSKDKYKKKKKKKKKREKKKETHESTKVTILGTAHRHGSGLLDSNLVPLFHVLFHSNLIIPKLCFRINKT
jgi:hypothetical protein